MKKYIGFSLLEMVIVIILLGVISVVAGKLIMQSFNSYLTNQNISQADSQARIAFERMARDIRGIGSLSNLFTALSDQLIFNDANANTYNYQLNNGNLTLNGNVLANGIGGLNFTYYQANGTSATTIAQIRYVQVSMSVTMNGTNFNLSTMVYPRNL